MTGEIDHSRHFNQVHCVTMALTDVYPLGDFYLSANDWAVKLVETLGLPKVESSKQPGEHVSLIFQGNLEFDFNPLGMRIFLINDNGSQLITIEHGADKVDIETGPNRLLFRVKKIGGVVILERDSDGEFSIKSLNHKQAEREGL